MVANGYINQKRIFILILSNPLEKYDNISDYLDQLPRPQWDTYISNLEECLNRQIGRVGDFCGIADRNTAGFTENSLRIRGYENWFLDTLVDPAGVEALLEIILEDKIRYWDAVIDWLLMTGNEHKIQVISEGDDLGAQDSTILEPDMLRTMVIPRMKRLFTLYLTGVRKFHRQMLDSSSSIMYWQRWRKSVDTNSTRQRLVCLGPRR